MKRMLLISALAATNAFAFQGAKIAKPEPTNVVLTKAEAKAAREKKNVLVVFGASWCGWCRKLDTMLSDPKLKPEFEKNYVIVHLDVMENGDKKALENPGGGEYLAKMGGEKSGLPFFVVLDARGSKLADSLRTPGDQGSNTGYPAADEEIAHFMDLLKKTAPKMSAATRDAIALYAKKSVEMQNR